MNHENKLTASRIEFEDHPVCRIGKYLSDAIKIRFAFTESFDAICIFSTDKKFAESIKYTNRIGYKNVYPKIEVYEKHIILHCNSDGQTKMAGNLKTFIDNVLINKCRLTPNKPVDTNVTSKIYEFMKIVI